MKKTILNSHKIHNYLTRIRSIIECIEQEGDSFVTTQVIKDIDEALACIKSEFKKVDQEAKNEKSN